PPDPSSDDSGLEYPPPILPWRTSGQYWPWSQGPIYRALSRWVLVCAPALTLSIACQGLCLGRLSLPHHGADSGSHVLRRGVEKGVSLSYWLVHGPVSRHLRTGKGCNQLGRAWSTLLRPELAVFGTVALGDEGGEDAAPEEDEKILEAPEGVGLVGNPRTELFTSMSGVRDQRNESGFYSDMGRPGSRKATSSEQILTGDHTQPIDTGTHSDRERLLFDEQAVLKELAAFPRPERTSQGNVFYDTSKTKQKLAEHALNGTLERYKGKPRELKKTSRI
ncbi:hypothetical protein THAOC_07795, partial [Thalassiosira oceanica]